MHTGPFGVACRGAVVAASLLLAGCADASSAGVVTSPDTTLASTTTLADTTTSSTSPSSTTTSTTTTTTSTTTTTTTTISPVGALPNPALPATNAAFDALADGNDASSMTVISDGRVVLARASGTTIDGAAAGSDSPMVVASVSKLLTATLIARMHETGLIDVGAPVPWVSMGLAAHAGWNDVTPRELLTHTSGMPVVRREWFVPSGDCAGFLPTLLVDPPRSHRGEWTYSNGNYCALGLLVEAMTGLPLDQAAQAVLLDPIGAAGVHLTTGGQLPTDVGYALGVERLARLGGAGAFIASTDDIAAVLASITPADRDVMTFPGVFVDQYGWGHTGTIDGAVSCAWVMERTIVVATVAGNRPGTGGAVCDRVVVAVADDLGSPAGKPDRLPR